MLTLSAELQDPSVLMPYFHNRRTGESVYEKPKEYEQWERDYNEYIQEKLLMGRG